MIIDFYSTFISNENQQVILSKVKRSISDSRFDPRMRTDESIEQYEKRIEAEHYRKYDMEINMNIFANILSCSRNAFSHEGDYTAITFPNIDFDVPLIQRFIIQETEKEQGTKERVYDSTLILEHLDK